MVGLYFFFESLIICVFSHDEISPRRALPIIYAEWGGEQPFILRAISCVREPIYRVGGDIAGGAHGCGAAYILRIAG